MRVVCLMALCLAAGCGRLPNGVGPYFDRFNAAAALLQVSLVHPTSSVFVQMGTVPASSPDPNAQCDPSGLSPTLTISTDYWIKADDERREILIFRALGHCLLNRDYGGTGLMNAAPDAYFFEAYLANPTLYQTYLFKGI